MIAAMALMLAGIGGPAHAGQDRVPPTPRAEPLKRLVACRAIVDPAARVACYDTEVSAIDAAERKRDLVVLDRSGVRAARRSLFGLQLPSFKIFDGDGGRDEPEFTELQTTIKASQPAANGWLLTLEDGARWAQTEPMELSNSPRPGNRIRIRQGALGSYLANIEGQRAIRVRRIN